jgi:hypothetical protein
MFIDMNPHLNQTSNRRGLSVVNPLRENPMNQIRQQPLLVRDR